MWEARSGFHIRIACCCLPELVRRAITQRTVRPFAVILPTPACQCNPHIVQRAEPVRVQALVAPPPVEALHVSVLHRSARLDMHQRDLPHLGPAQHPSRTELGPVVRAQTLGAAVLRDHLIQLSNSAGTRGPARRELKYACSRISSFECRGRRSVRRG